MAEHFKCIVDTEVNCDHDCVECGYYGDCSNCYYCDDCDHNSHDIRCNDD